MDNVKDFLGKIKKHEILILTIFVAIIGMIVFMLIYGVEVLNVTNVSWLNNSGDLTQHHYGWVFFRNSDWTFPIGLFNNLSYPDYSSIVYTDSIPLFAIFFKSISSILPQAFQYLGIFGLMCYMLQGVFAFTLLRKFINNKFYTIIGTIFFIISPYMLQRMFGHTALSANFLILAALCLWAYREKYKNSAIRKILLWTLLLVSGVVIHMYYIPMLVIIMLCTFISEFMENRKSYKLSIITFVISCVLAIFVLYIFGGFTSNSFESGGIDFYNANFNTFINPQGFSRFLKDLPTATIGEYEGLGYLGLGILIMCFLSIVLLVQNYNWKEFVRLLKKPNTVFVILCIFFSMWVAIGTSVKLNSHILFNINYPNFILKILSAFRSSGRFVWLPCYIIFLVSMYFIFKNTNRKTVHTVIIICLMVQFLDLYPTIKDKFEYQERQYECDLESWKEVLNNSKHIACIPVSEFKHEELFKIAFIANENDCTINNFYFARDVQTVGEQSDKYLDNLQNGTMEKDFVYIMKKGTEEIEKDPSMNYYDIDDYIVIKAK